MPRRPSSAGRHSFEWVLAWQWPRRAARCSRMPSTVTASRSGSVLMVGAADAGLVIRSELATASAQANDKCLRMRNPPRGEMILSGHCGRTGGSYPGHSIDRVLAGATVRGMSACRA